MKIRHKPWGTLLATICIGILCPICLAASQSVKTSFKRYAIYPYNEQKVLCEPYQVAKDDWLYKIFRQKGEISEKDFPLFLAIFKSMNPEVSNIDAINPGQKILIPLKTISQEDFNETTPGVVDVPVIEFSTLEEKLSPNFIKHLVKKGDTVSELLDPVFLNKDGTLTEQALRLFSLANPDVTQVELIQEGTILNLPTQKNRYTPPENKNIPFRLEPLSEKTFAGLEQYTRMHQGELIRKGKYYFPAKGLPDKILDLEYTPLIKLMDGSRIIMIPGKGYDHGIEAVIRNFWKKVTLVEIETALETVAMEASTEDFPKAFTTPENILDTREIPLDHRLATKKLLDQTGFEYTPDTTISLHVGNLDLDIKVDRIHQQEATELFIEYGEVYGFALEQLKERGYKLISLFPRETTRQIAIKLFSSLGIPIIEDPAFISTRTYRTVTIPGIYISRPPEEIMVVEGNLDMETRDFLEQKKIKLLHMELPN